MFRYIPVVTAAALLAACGGGGAGSASMVTSTTAVKTVMSSDANPRPEVFELSCAEIGTRLGNLQARYDELAAEQKKKQRGKSLLSGLVSSTIGIVGGVQLEMVGRTVWRTGGREADMLICLDRDLDEAVIDAMAAASPKQAVCLDAGFGGDDELKANAVQSFAVAARRVGREIRFRTV